MTEGPLFNWQDMSPKTKLWLGIAALLSFLPFILVLAFEAVETWSEDRQMSIILLVTFPAIFGASYFSSRLQTWLKNTGFADQYPWLAKQCVTVLDMASLLIFMGCAMILNGDAITNVIFMVGLLIALILAGNAIIDIFWKRYGPNIKTLFSRRS